MSPAFSTRRRAERFDALVSDPAHLGAAGSSAEREWLRVVEELRSVPAVAPRPEFSADLRERLMVEAESALVTLDPAEARLRMPARSRSRDRRIATVVGGAALLGATTSMAVAAQTALPGDSLYPVKRALEEAETSFANDDAARGEALLSDAQVRLTEVDALTLRGTTEGIAAVPETLVEFKAQSLEASDLMFDAYDTSGDPASLSELRTFTHDSMELLLGLDAQLPEAARDELVDAARTLTEIDDRARQLCPDCGAGITSIPPFLLSSDGLSSLAEKTTAVPSAEPLGRPQRAGDRKRGKGDGGRKRPGITVPDVDLGEGTTATGGGSQGTPGSRPPQQQDDQAGGGAADKTTTSNPVKDLTEALTNPGSTSRKNRKKRPLGNVLNGVGDTVDKITTGLLD